MKLGSGPYMLLTFLLLSACGLQFDLYGAAANYRPEHPDPIKVYVPANAPYISQEFYTPKGESRQHGGIDIWAARGTPILAAAPGRVVESFSGPMYGNQVVLDHGPDENGVRVRTVYKHMDSRLVQAGQVVARGQQLGTMGDTGILGAQVHLHFEVRKQVRSQSLARDPHLFWADGVGRVTCFDPAREIPEIPFRTTYPVPCK